MKADMCQALDRLAVLTASVSISEALRITACG